MEVDNKKNDENIIPNDADKPQKGVNVPNLRFSEFDYFWLPTTLSSICSFRKKRKSSIKKFYVSTENILQNYKGIEQYNSNEVISGVEFLTGDILMANIRPYLKKVYMAEFDGVSNSDVLIFKSDMVDSNFLHCILANDNFINYVMNSVKGSKMPRGDKIHIMNYHLSIPKAKEQEKIAKFIDLINQRIKTQSKIIEDLQTLKISICDKVFEDTTYPEYKLKDVLSERIEKSNVNNQYEILSSTIKGLFTQKEYFDKDIASSNNIGYKIVHLYDIIISPQNLWMGNITFNQRFTNGLVSPSYKIYIINNNFDMYYIANMLKTKRAMYKYICSSQQGASVVRRNLNMDDFLSLSFNIPDINKQRKIGLLLNTIDKRIDLEQTYLTKLNQQKKFLLKNMFI